MSGGLGNGAGVGGGRRAERIGKEITNESEFGTWVEDARNILTYHSTDLCLVELHDIVLGRKTCNGVAFFMMTVMLRN